METIVVKSESWDYRPGFQLLLIRSFLKKLENKEIILDFTYFKFCPPLLSIYFSKLIDNDSELSELTDNIVGHSRHDFGWISFQYYPSQGFMDICLADSGIGVLGSYLNYGGEKDYSQVQTHLDAVETMIKGGSTKSLKERGFGVHTSREMLVDGLNGTFVFLSGDALLINYQLTHFEVKSPGSLAFLRVPVLNLKENFNIYNYTE